MEKVPKPDCPETPSIWQPCIHVLDLSFYGVDMLTLCPTLGVKAALRYYDDGTDYNALASPEPRFADGPDGTVVLGLNLMSAETTRDIWHPRKPQPNGSTVRGIGSDIILAHELSHILQFKNGMTPDGPWQMEPHADFMAGWVNGRLSGKDTPYGPKADIENAALLMFDLGDSLFNDRRHHGEPEFRAAMVQAGWDARELNVDEAFAKGQKMAGLK